MPENPIRKNVDNIQLGVCVSFIKITSQNIYQKEAGEKPEQIILDSRRQVEPKLYLELMVVCQ